MYVLVFSLPLFSKLFLSYTFFVINPSVLLLDVRSNQAVFPFFFVIGVNFHLISYNSVSYSIFSDFIYCLRILISITLNFLFLFHVRLGLPLFSLLRFSICTPSFLPILLHFYYISKPSSPLFTLLVSFSVDFL